MYYDIHNHLFNKHFLAKELLYRLMKEMGSLSAAGEGGSLDESSASRRLKNAIRSLRRYTHAIRIFCRKNSTEIFRELDKTYRGEFLLTPLTFDLTWCFKPEASLKTPHGKDTEAAKDFKIESARFFRMAETHLRTQILGGIPVSNEENLLREKYAREKERFLKNAVKLLDSERQASLAPGSQGGWDEQIRQLQDMKENPIYRERIFPFLAVDPRRPGIQEYAREKVGRGNLFVGIKLYCPNGYSPTDPLLYGHGRQRDGIYAFCEDNGIPVTTHNSLGGFATLAKSVVITGDIYRDGKLISLDRATVKFKDSFFKSEGVYERAMTLNHPLIWSKVVEKYPGLLLNLAHFGGAAELGKALDSPDDSSLWSGKIIALLKDSRYRVYTDLSCFTEFTVLRKLLKSPVYPQIRHRILFGSDYTLLLLFENNFKANIRKFREYFRKDFDIIAGKNPREFLNHVV